MSTAVARASKRNTSDEQSISHRCTATPDNTAAVTYPARLFSA